MFGWPDGKPVALGLNMGDYKITSSPDGSLSYEEWPKIPWPDPTPEMLETPEFNAIWECIKYWDINVPGAYRGYCGATGNHVRAILDALEKVATSR